MKDYLVWEHYNRRKYLTVGSKSDKSGLAGILWRDKTNTQENNLYT